MARSEKREAQKELDRILNKGKKDMQSFVNDYYEQTQGIPTEFELKAWQKGYLAGINRGKSIS